MSKYPSEHDIAGWIDEYFASVEHRGMRYEAFLAMKACDWQREQDVRCVESAGGDNAVYHADAIRAQP